MTETTVDEQTSGPTGTNTVAGAPIADAFAPALKHPRHTAERAGAMMIEGFTSTQKEVSEFLSERIRQDMETQAEFLRCRTLDDIRGTEPLHG